MKAHTQLEQHVDYIHEYLCSPVLIITVNIIYETPVEDKLVKLMPWISC